MDVKPTNINIVLSLSLVDDASSTNGSISFLLYERVVAVKPGRLLCGVGRRRLIATTGGPADRYEGRK